MNKQILILPGDGVGPEIVAEAEKVIRVLVSKYDLRLSCKYGLIGGHAINETGVPLPKETLLAGGQADAILLGAVGGPEWDDVQRKLRPEKGLLMIRRELDLYANLRPAFLYNALVDASTLKPNVIADMDIMIVRELTSGIYFGEPRGIAMLENGQRRGFNTMAYTESEITRIAHTAFTVAMQRTKRICSVDKANVLEVSELWREVVIDVARDYPAVSLEHMYVDNFAMQLVRDPRQFDVVVTTNMFGDILSDLASMLVGSIGMLPSASLDPAGKGMYEPIHGSAPDIAGKNVANPLATILSLAMMLRYSLTQSEYAERVEKAVQQVLANGLRTADIYSAGTTMVSTSEMGDAVAMVL